MVTADVPKSESSSPENKTCDCQNEHLIFENMIGLESTHPNLLKK